MLGGVIRDPSRVESANGEALGLGVLPVATTFETAKATFQARARITGRGAWLQGLAGGEVEGYEIHMGRTSGGRSWLRVFQRNGAPADVADGAMSDDGRIWGCYLHGVFANTALRRAWLTSVAARFPEGNGAAAISLHTALDRLADAAENALDMSQLDAIVRGGGAQ
jgi:adenosylcobyric acid synthase